MGGAYLDDLVPTESEVGFGSLGLGGHLGYESQHVRVQGAAHVHAISAHPPSRVVFALDGGYRSFRATVAINDDVRRGLSHANFEVLADGVIVARAARVMPGSLPILLVAQIEGASRLELRVDSERLEYSHAVWIEPELSREASPISDCLERVWFDSAGHAPRAQRCVATVATPDYAPLLDTFLGSLRANGGRQDLVVVLAVDADDRTRAIALAHDATVIECRAQRSANSAVKSALYSIARVVAADQYLCLDSDMLVLDALDPVFAALDACPDGSLFASIDQNRETYEDLGRALVGLYRGRETDIEGFVGAPFGEARDPRVLNDGAFAGDRRALLALDSSIRAMPGAATWVDAFYLRNQFLFNLALARMRCAVRLADVYNLQLHAQNVMVKEVGGRSRVEWRGQPVRILHFNAAGRARYSEWRSWLLRDREVPLPDVHERA